MNTEPRRTIFYELQRSAGARFVDFGGWEMPVQFTSILDEHAVVRTTCGVFDISHMGEIFVSGPASFDWLQRMLSNDLSKCAEGCSQYTFLLNPHGGVIDDLIVYRLGALEFLLLVNAAKVAEDAEWLREHAGPGVVLDDRSDAMSALAVQGPESGAVFRALFGHARPARNTFEVLGDGGSRVIAAGTGYTGEAGFEMFFPHEAAAGLWGRVIAAGAKPCGLGARDTLRLEMCYPLNGSDLSPERTPLEAGLGIFVALDKPDFIGREALVAQKATGVPSRLAAIRMTCKAPPPRSHYPVLAGGEKVGETTSGALSPSLGEGIAMAYLRPDLAKPGQPLEIEIRGRAFAAAVAKKPFYRPTSAPAA